MFRRRKDGEPVEGDAAHLDAIDPDADGDGAGADVGPAMPLEGGPRDAADVDLAAAAPLVDFGALLVPGIDGMEVRVDADEAGNLIAVTVVIEESAVQMSAFAAPRSGGIWDDIRAEIAAAVVESGGTARDESGRFGAELVADVPVTLPDGATSTEPMRFVGADGPRWFVRGLISGRAATDRSAALAIEDVFAGVLVNRGDHAAPPREPLVLTLPAEAQIPDDGTPGAG